MFGQLGFLPQFAGRTSRQAAARPLRGRVAPPAWGAGPATGRDWHHGHILPWPTCCRCWVNNLVGFYGAADLVGYADSHRCSAMLAAFLARPAAVWRLLVPARRG